MDSPTNLVQASIDCVWEAGAILGESPCWDHRSDRLLWLDIKGLRLHAYSPRKELQQTWELPARICSIDVPGDHWLPPRALSGEAFIACGDFGLAWVGLQATTTQLIPLSQPEHDQPRNRFNDGKMGLDGRYWAGTMDDREELVTGRLYAFHPDGTFVILDEGYRVTNGPAFSPDKTTVYHTDSACREIYAFDNKSDGTLGRKRVLIRFGEHDGYPDGMTTDQKGNLWVAMWDGACIYKVSSAGERLGAVCIPTRRPTSCIFSEPDCSEMFVTSARIGLKNDDHLAGGLFRIGLK